MILQLLFFASIASTTIALNITVCDCTNVKKVQLFKFAQQCKTPPSSEVSSEAVNYQIYTSHQETIDFAAFLCRRWINQLTVTSNIFDYKINNFKDIPMETTESDCRNLIQSKLCDGKQMLHQGEMWAYQEEATGDGSWLYPVTYVRENCIVKPVKLQKKCNEEYCSVVTPFGDINTTETFYSHSHNTMVWEPSWTSITKARFRIIEKGNAKLLHSKKKTLYALRIQLNKLISISSYHTLKPFNRTDLHGLYTTSQTCQVIFSIII